MDAGTRAMQGAIAGSFSFVGTVINLVSLKANLQKQNSLFNINLLIINPTYKKTLQPTAYLFYQYQNNYWHYVPYYL